MDLRSDSHPSQPSGNPPPPRVSVIVPAHNDATRLARCLAALKTSTFADYEVIVADDGSTDDTATVAQSMGADVVRLPTCSGPAAARNAAARQARGDILLFIDADVCVHPDTILVAVQSFEDPALSATFGSYDLDPAEPSLLSQYKNLTHRFHHQQSPQRVGTFWTGCGAIRRDVFNAFKFDDPRFPRPSIEDIDMGARMTAAGHRIIVNKNLQAKHLKRWTFWGIIKSDLFDRAIPWTRLIHRQKDLPADLNLNPWQRIAALLTALSAAIFVVACWFKPWLLLVPPAIVGLIVLADRWTTHHRPSAVFRSLTGGLILAGLAAMIAYGRGWTLAILASILPVLLINRRFFHYLIDHRGPLMGLTAVPMLLLYYLYSLLGFAAGTLLHLADSLDDRRVRIRLYVAIANALYAASWALVVVRAHYRQTTIDFAVSDAIGYYAYLPSLVIDGDLDFSNQLVDQQVKDPFYLRDMRNNRWPAGVAMSIAPAFVVAHGLALAGHSITGWPWLAPIGYTPIYFVLCVAWAMGLGTLAMIVADRLLVERLNVSGRIAAAAVLTTWLGTNFLWYFTREPLLAHMLGASWVIFSVYLIHRIERNALRNRLVWWELPLLAFTTAMVLSCRLADAFIAPLFVYLLVVLIQHGLIVQTLKLIPLILIALAPLIIQITIQQTIRGQVVAHDVQGLGYSQHEGFRFDRPALLRTLFSSRHGLFFTTPALLLAAWGIIRHLVRSGRHRDPLIVIFALSALLLWYVNAAWYAWWFGPSVGHRGFVALAGLFVIGFALGYQWLEEVRPRTRRIVLGLLVIAFAFNYALMAGKLVDLIDDNQTLIPWEDRIFQGRWERL